MRDVSAFSELAQPLRSFLVDDLLKFKVIVVEIQWLVDIIQEILDRKGTEFLPILKRLLLLLRVHVGN